MSRSTLLVALLALATNAAAQNVPLRRGSTATGSLATGDTISYVVDAGADFFVMGFVDQRSVDVVVRVLAPNGQQIRRVDGPARGPERFNFEADEAGQYRIQVIPFEEEVGDYSITLERLEPLAKDPKKLVDQLMAPYDRTDSPGGAVAVWRNGRSLFSKSYGMANLAYGIPFRVDTRTNIGSTSKQFTAFAIMLQAQRGKLSLDDDIRKHIPELPEFDETITVRHIITHTSGLREFLNLLLMTGRRMDHGDYIDRDELIEIVKRQPALQNSPGAEWNYNNTAFGLAALIVERTSGQPFDEFMAENVFGPLGMTRTMVRPSPEHVVPDASQGYVPSGDGFLEAKDLGGAVGAGGIYTTIGDLQRWVENMDSPEPKVGSPDIFREMMTPYVLTNGDTTSYGYGLSIDEQRGLKRVQHGGADVAHRSMLAYYPEIHAGVTAQSNHAGFNSGVAFRIAEAFFGDEMEPEKEAVAEGASFDPASYDPEDFEDFVGRYELDVQPGFVLTFTREDSKLYTQATGQSRIEIVPTSDSTFALTAVEASVTFHRDDDGTIEGLTLHQGGQEPHATRLAGDDGEGWEPGADDLEDFEGRYFSEELETFYTITVEEEKLTVRQRRMEDIHPSPGEKDTFNGGGLTFSFERDRNGVVIGFYLANGRTRDVRFERLR
jgi:CubicO group peptidase (beta-lactamase class C family)